MRFPKDIAMLIALEIHRYNISVLNKQYKKQLVVISACDSLLIEIGVVLVRFNWRRLRNTRGDYPPFPIYNNNKFTGVLTPQNYKYTVCTNQLRRAL